MKLLLCSNGSAFLDNIKRVFAGNLSDIKIGYITTASKVSKDISHMLECQAGLREMGIGYQEIDLMGKNQFELREFFRDKNMIYTEGGNTFYLLEAMRESGFVELVRELVNEGMIYAGASAGAYVACPTIEVATWNCGDKEEFGVIDYTALGLVSFVIFAHYEDKYKNIVQKNSENCKYEVKVLRDGQAIWIDGEKEEFLS